MIWDVRASIGTINHTIFQLFFLLIFERSVTIPLSSLFKKYTNKLFGKINCHLIRLSANEPQSSWMCVRSTDSNCNFMRIGTNYVNFYSLVYKMVKTIILNTNKEF